MKTSTTVVMTKAHLFSQENKIVNQNSEDIPDIQTTVDEVRQALEDHEE